jgi:hypothetical protein
MALQHLLGSNTGREACLKVTLALTLALTLAPVLAPALALTLTLTLTLGRRLPHAVRPDGGRRAHDEQLAAAALPGGLLPVEPELALTLPLTLALTPALTPTLTPTLTCTRWSSACGA